MFNVKKDYIIKILLIVLIICGCFVSLNVVSADSGNFQNTYLEIDDSNNVDGISTGYESLDSDNSYLDSIDSDFSSNDVNLKSSDHDSLSNDMESVYYVSADGSDLNDGKSFNTSFNTLDKALSMDYSGLKVVYMDKGNFKDLNNSNLIINPNENISIIGSSTGKTILDAESLNRFFVISKNSKVTLSNLHFINGFDSYKGGAILNSGNLTLVNCTFRSNKVFSGESNNRNLSVYGAAIYSDGTLSVIDSNFTNNALGSKFQLFSYGGAIYSKGLLLVNGSYFENNELNAFLNPSATSENEYNASLRGGAIFASGDEVQISNSKFINHELFAYYKVHDNYRTFALLSEGGAIFIDGNGLRVKNCSFYENHADAGGAISFFGNNVTFEDSFFANNSAYTGAAIFSIDFLFNGKDGFDILPSYSNNHSIVLIDNCDFDGNYIYCDVSDGYFRYYRGGGAVLLKLDNISIINSNFNENGVFENIEVIESNFCYGGAVYTMGDNSRIFNCSFTDNIANMGGSIVDRGLNTSISNSTFENNHALIGDGGAIFHQRGDNLHINNSYFNSNNASCGGAIYSIARYYVDESYNNHYSIYENSQFVNNTAEYGGGIYDNGDYITYLNLTFENNTANYGGAIYNQGLANRFDKSTFTGNKAVNKDYSHGGAIYNYGSNTDYFDCVFIDNSADNLGGAIYNSGNDIYCVNSSFFNNSAFKGGTVYLRGSKGKIQSNNISKSFAIYGGAIFNEGTEMIISLNNFTNILANITGASIYNIGDNLTLSGNSMTDCSSALSGQGYGDYIYTQAGISYLVVTFLENATFSILDHDSSTIFANVTDDMGNPITGGNISFIIVNNLNGESTTIGTSKVIEGIALLDYGEDLDFGTYLLSGSYEYAREPVLTKTGNILAALSTAMHLTIGKDLSTDIELGSGFNFDLVLIDSNDTYLANVPISLYKNGVYIASLTTDDFGFASYSIECNSLGIQEYYLVYNGDLIHNKVTSNFTFNVIYNPQIDYRNSSLISYYPIVIASSGDGISFELYFEDKDNQTPLAHISTTRYFLVYKNGELMDYRREMDYDGVFYGTKLIYYTEKGVDIYKVHSSGNSYLFLSEETPGIYVYDVEFKGGHVIGYELDSNNGVVTKHDYGYYYPNNLSLILIIKEESASISSVLDLSGSLNISNVEFANYSIYLSDENNNPLSNKEVFVYDNGVLLGSAFTDSGGYANYTFEDYLDTGSHLIEFVYGGNSEYLPVYDAFFLEVYENPNKENLTLENISNSKLKGSGNNFTGIIKDKNNLTVSNLTIDLEILSTILSLDDISSSSISLDTVASSAFSLRNYTVKTDENGIFSIPLELGAGNFLVKCTFNGNRFYNGLTSLFLVNLSKVSTTLYGLSMLEVIEEDCYLSYVLADEFFYPLNNTRIKIDAFSEEFNASYYAFTNESGACRLKVTLPAGKYSVIASYDGDIWHAKSGDVLTNLTVYGSQSYLKANDTVFIIESGQYKVRLVDSFDNPIVGEAIMITVSNKTYTRYTDDEGYASLNINLKKGIYPISSKYIGKIEYKGSSINSTLYVVDKDYKFPSVLAANSSFTFRGTGNYTVHLTDIFSNPLVNQSLKIYLNGDVFEVKTDDDGLGTLEISLDKGNYQIKTVYEGNDSFKNSSIISDLVIVSENAVVTVLDCPVYTVLKGNNTLFAITLKDKLDNPIVGEKIVIELNGATYTRITDNQGKVYLNINLISGSYTIKAKFLGCGDYFASECEGKIVVIGNNLNATVDNGSSIVSQNDTSNNSSSKTVKKSTKIVASNIVKYYKDSKKLAIYLKDSNGKAIAGRQLSVTIKSKTYKAKTDKNGRLNLVINYAKGDYAVKIKFEGDSSYKASSKKIIVKVVIPKIKAKKTSVKRYKKLQVMFKTYNGKVIKNQKVFIKIKGKKYFVKTNKNGIASLVIKFKKGTYKVVSGFKSTSVYGKYTKSFKVKVK